MPEAESRPIEDQLAEMREHLAAVTAKLCAVEDERDALRARVGTVKKAAPATPATPPAKPATRKAVAFDAAEFGRNVGRTIKGQVAPIREALAALEARVSKMEDVQKRGFYRGVHAVGQQYAAGEGVTFKGAMWIAMRETDATPGEPDSGWKLAVKRGRDGRPDREKFRGQ